MTEELKEVVEEKNNQLEPLLEARNITKRFPGVLALNDVSLKFMPGEVHAVVGENGAGKSTLMKIMAGAYVADSGEILLQGERVSFNHPREAQLKGVSIIYQEFNLATKVILIGGGMIKKDYGAKTNLGWKSMCVQCATCWLGQ